MAKIKVVEKGFEEVAQPRQARLLVRVGGELEVAASWAYALELDKVVTIYTYEDENDRGSLVIEYANLNDLADSILMLVDAYAEECKEESEEECEIEVQVVGDPDLYEILSEKAQS